MTGVVTVVFADEQPPGTWAASLFIAGPMPRTTEVPSWRPEALEAVEAAWAGAGELVVFVPEPRNGKPLQYDHHAWEDRWLAVVDVIMFWVPRDMRQMPGLTTNVEFGRWEASGRVVFGAPPQAAHVGYLRECATRNGAPVATSLDGTVAAVMTMIGSGSRRSGAERQIPLLVWTHPELRRWLTALRRTGYALVAARVLWLQQGEDGAAVRWMMHARLGHGEDESPSSVFVSFGDVDQADVMP